MSNQSMLNKLVEIYQSSLTHIGLPEQLHSLVIEKLYNETFDAGTYVQFAENDHSHQLNLDTDGENLDTLDSLAEFLDQKIAMLPRKFDLIAVDDMKRDSNVFLIDHMWTTTFPQSKKQLAEIPGLASRIANLLQLPLRKDPDTMKSALTAEDIDTLWNSLWPYFNSYTIDNDEYTSWFLMDEVGSSLANSNTPNCKCVPFLFRKDSRSHPFIVSLLWPVASISSGEPLTSDYLPSVPVGQPCRPLRLLGYLPPPKSMKNCVSESPSLQTYSDEYSFLLRHVANCSNSEISLSQQMNGVAPMVKPTASLSVQVDWIHTFRRLQFLAKHHCGTFNKNSNNYKNILQVYCDRSDHINSTMLHYPDRISLCSDPAHADVLYLVEHTKTTSNKSNGSPQRRRSNSIAGSDPDFEEECVKTGKTLNQFWWNGLVVSKEHLASTVRAAHVKKNGLKSSEDHSNVSEYPLWLQPTYDLGQPADLAKFAFEYSRRIENCSDLQADGNIWILKRYRGRQSVDYPITSNFSCALRHLDSAPRIASNYITTPVLYRGRKFDLRYYVLVHSLEPLVLSRHRLFNVRCAIKNYTLSDLEDFQTQFTVMSLLDDPTMQNVRGAGKREDPDMETLMKAFKEDYGGRVRAPKPISQVNGPTAEGNIVGSWGDVQPAIDEVLRAVFESVREVYQDQPPHPSGHTLHPNAGWSLNQPNACPARAMFGVDILLDLTSHPRESLKSSLPIIQPVVLEVQWAPDASGQALHFCPTFWDEVLSALYLDDLSAVIPL